MLDLHAWLYIYFFISLFRKHQWKDSRKNLDTYVRVISFYQNPNSKFQNSLTQNRTTYFFDLFWSNELSQLAIALKSWLSSLLQNRSKK